ncbi:uncharacterized protein LOC118488172 [Helianthus annuus]|uniref:uncharacterized protein LOC118488172 n=1 Tax=Helianthus annuus TaxID=4232 RepID=UPI0016530FF9|nr:uncharacterized protein LOC118488172 [Helianthus annuus]
MEIARWFYDAGIPFHGATYDSFHIMLEAVAQFGPGFRVPTMYELRVPLLTKEVEDTKLEIDNHKKEWAAKGCSILSDGWRDSTVQKDIINFLVNSPKGSVFVKSIDVSEITKDADQLLGMLEEMVDEVGEENVVIHDVLVQNSCKFMQLVQNSCFSAEFMQLVQNSCCLLRYLYGLLDIGKIPKIKECLKNEMFANAFTYNHTKLVNLMRRFTNQRNLHRPAMTRFATSFITFAQMHKQKNNLLKMVLFDEWRGSKWAKEAGGRKVASTFQ